VQLLAVERTPPQRPTALDEQDALASHVEVRPELVGEQPASRHRLIMADAGDIAAPPCAKVGAAGQPWVSWR
jgi:hypothetical protein